jgi:hypothetical protein
MCIHGLLQGLNYFVTVEPLVLTSCLNIPGEKIYTAQIFETLGFHVMHLHVARHSFVQRSLLAILTLKIHRERTENFSG